MPSPIIVRISDCAISDDPAAVLVTHALGSCVGTVLYDGIAKVGGLLHVLLPVKTQRLIEDKYNPFMFADSGVRQMYSDMCKAGASPGRITARLAGGANMLSVSSVLDIGRRNTESVLRTLEQLGVEVTSQCLGGTVGRSMSLEMETGKVLVNELGMGETEL